VLRAGVVLRGIDAERRNASRRGNIHLTVWKIFALFAQGFYFLGAAMRAVFKTLVLIAGSIGLAAGLASGPVKAADLGLMTTGRGGCSEIVFTCENGRAYPLCPIAVTVAGEVVTASLHLGHGSPMHVRLIPMGVGYRYAGHGVWLDGFRENALLNFGKNSQIACTIEHS
jgi:hypothetical protein